MAGYIGDIPVPQATQTRQTFTATASQTSFPTIGYTAGFIDVYLNGIKLLDTVDYAATNGSDVVLTTGAALNDILEVTIFDTFTTSSGTTTNTTHTNATLKSNVTLKNDTEEDSDGGRASKIIYQGEQSGGEITTLAEIQASHDGSADDQKGDLIFRTNDGSDGTSPTERLRINNTEVVFNDNSNDLDFRVESNDNANMLVVNGGDNAIGIGIDSPSTMLHLFDGGTDTGITIQSKVAANATSSITMMSRKSDNTNLNCVIQNEAGAFTFDTNSTERLRITSGGDLRVGINSDMGGVINASHADGVAIGSANDQTYYRRIYGTAGANLELRFWNGSNEGSLNSSGAWVNASDVSLKENIADIEYGIDTVKSLKPRKYTMKEGGNSEVGFIAQEMESVVPEVVNTSENPNKDEIKGISYGQLTAVLTKALQEAIAKIETLETKVAALEAE